MKSHKIVVIGSGAAGIAAATRLLENNFDDVVVLEAANRIGGRIKSVPFEGTIVDLGAQWCHGEDENIVHKLAKDLDLLSPSFNSYDEFILYESTGKIIDKDVSDSLLQIAWNISSDDDALKNSNKSFGEYFIERYNEEVKNEIKDVENYLDLAWEVQEFVHKLTICLDASPTWFDVSAKGSLHYKPCQGNYYLNWRHRGYQTILDVLMKKLPSSQIQLPIDDKIFLDKEVCKIMWKDNSINPGGVTVRCLDGATYNADHVIVTVPLGVLKHKHKNLFDPELPMSKQVVINNLGFGTVNKILLKFPAKWWPENCKGFSFIWTKHDSENITKEFTQGPCKDGRSWIEDIYGFYVIDNHPKMLLGWIVGTQLSEVEQLPSDIMLNGCMYLLNKFLGNKFTIPKADDILCSSWSTDPHFYGSYSYRCNETEKANVSANDLAKPLVVKDKEVVLFAGEATHSCFYSTVHGAIETGFREADRIIDMHKVPNVEKHKVVIVGAGLAGLGAGQALIKSGCKDFIILEAQSHIGGRIKTIPFGNGVIDLGAQWIHGTGTSLYKIAKRYELLSPITSEEGLGVYVRDDGFVFDNYLVKQVDFEIGRILEQCETFVDAIEYPESVGDFLEEKFNEYLKRCLDSDEVARIKRELLEWHVRFQIIDNSCVNLKDLSAKDWGRYYCPDNNGQAHINLKTGYKSLVDALTLILPDDSIRCNTAVINIQWQNINNNVRVICDNDLIIDCDHVIVTTSLGVLKNCSSTLFEPSLPERHIETIKSMGYCGIAKLFLVFDCKWWNTDGIQLIWRKDTVLSGPDKWTRCISGFDVVMNQPNVLLAWVGGEAVTDMEKLSESMVGAHCVQLLKRFLKRNDIPLPLKVIRSKWLSNPWIRGGYSYTTTQCDRNGVGPSTLSEPIYVQSIPKILFAGEAVHQRCFSTTHGAFESGENQARFLLDFIS